MALNLSRFFKGRGAADSVVTDNNHPEGFTAAPRLAAAQDGSGTDNANRSAAPGAPHGGDGFIMQDGELYPRAMQDVFVTELTGPGPTGAMPAGLREFFDKQNMPLNVAGFTGSDEEIGALIAYLQGSNLIDTSTGEIVWADEAQSQAADSELEALVAWLRSNNLIDTSTGEIVWAAAGGAQPNAGGDAFVTDLIIDPPAAQDVFVTEVVAGNGPPATGVVGRAEGWAGAGAEAARHAGPGAPHEGQGFMMQDGELYPRGIKFDGVEGEAVDATARQGVPGATPEGLLPYVEQSNVLAGAGPGGGPHLTDMAARHSVGSEGLERQGEGVIGLGEPANTPVLNTLATPGTADQISVFGLGGGVEFSAADGQRADIYASNPGGGLLGAHDDGPSTLLHSVSTGGFGVTAPEASPLSLNFEEIEVGHHDVAAGDINGDGVAEMDADVDV